MCHARLGVHAVDAPENREKSMCAASATGISPARIILPCTVLELVLERRRRPHVGKSGKRVAQDVAFYLLHCCLRNSGKRPLSFFHLFGRLPPTREPWELWTTPWLAQVHVHSTGLVTEK